MQQATDYIKAPFRIYEGSSLLQTSEAKAEPIVQDFLYENDYAMLIASEKAGKTILSMQLAASVSSGIPFLGMLEIPKAYPVWYFATEGKDEDLKDRFIRMNPAVPVNVNNLKLICSAGFRFNTAETSQWLEFLIHRYEEHLPKLIIIDALYMAIKGDLNSNKDVNEFHHTMRKFAEHCDAAVLLVHHMTKPTRNPSDGKINHRSDDDAYGSAFLKAAIDQCFWLEKWKKGDESSDGDRVLRCDTQRSGNIINDIRLRLMSPDPLYFTVVSKHHEEGHRIITVLKSVFPQGQTAEQLCKKCTLGRSTFYVLIKKLIEDGVVRRDGAKTKTYYLTCKNQKEAQ